MQNVIEKTQMPVTLRKRSAAVKVAAGTPVTLYSAPYGTYTQGILVGDGFIGGCGTYTLRVGDRLYRNEGTLIKGWV